MRRVVLVALLAAVAACSEPTSKPTVQMNVASTHALVDALARAGRGLHAQDAAARRLAQAYTAVGVPVSLQQVPYISMQPTATSFVVTGANWSQSPAVGTGYITWTRRAAPQVSLAGAPVVFAGYGIVSTSLQWDDYKNADVKGKVVLVLDAEPRNGGHDELGTLGDTYLGRSDYKFEEAAHRGAAAVIVVYDDGMGPAGWANIGAWISDGVLTFADRVTDPSGVPLIEGWMTSAAAASMLKAAGLDLAKLTDLAHERNFEPIEVKAQAAMSVTSTLTRDTGSNVVATVRGTTPEYVVVSSGMNEPVPLGGDRPAAPAMLVALADAFTRRPAPLRSIVFLSSSTTRDEGLVGLTYWAGHPTVPLAATRAVMFLAGANLFARPGAFQIIGSSYEGLSNMVMDAAGREQRLVSTLNGRAVEYYRQSQEAFAAAAVPYLYITGTPAGSVQESQAIDETAAESDLSLLFDVINTAQGTTNWPAGPPPESLPGRN